MKVRPWRTSGVGNGTSRPAPCSGVTSSTGSTASTPSSSTARSRRSSRRVHAGDRDRVRAAVLRSVATGRAADEEYRIVRPDGEERWLHTRAEPTINSAGDVVALRGVGQDITDKRRGT